MGWRSWGRIHDPTLSILSMVILVIRSWNKKRQQVWHQLLAEIGHGISVGTACIDGTFTLELNSETSCVCIILFETIKRWRWFLHFLIDLTEYTMCSIMITLTGFSEEESFTALDADLMLGASSWQLLDLVLYHQISYLKGEGLQELSPQEGQGLWVAELKVTVRQSFINLLCYFLEHCSLFKCILHLWVVIFFELLRNVVEQLLVSTVEIACTLISLDILEHIFFLFNQ